MGRQDNNMVKNNYNQEREWAVLATDVKYIREKIDNFIPDIKENTKFRQQARGVIGGIAFVFTALGAGIFYMISWVLGGK